MKKILIVLGILLITTGCTCEYNLDIENGKYNEEIKINAKTVSEKNNFNNEWKIPTNKNEYDIGIDSENADIDYTKIYSYRTSGNSLIFSQEANRGEYNNSTAVYNCYNKLSVDIQSGSTIISTSNAVKCFDKYPDLTEITVNITVDKPVKSCNADNAFGNTYTWNLNRSNANNKPINLIIETSEKDKSDVPTTTSSNPIVVEEKRDYSTFILAAIIGILFLIGYGLYKKFQSKDEQI